MKDKDYFARLCDFSKLSNFVQNYSSNYYEQNPYTTPASCPATQEFMQMIEKKCTMNLTTTLTHCLICNHNNLYGYL